MRKSKMYQVPEAIVEAAEKQAKERRKRSGALVRWSDIIREVLVAHFQPPTKEP